MQTLQENWHRIPNTITGLHTQPAEVDISELTAGGLRDILGTVANCRAEGSGLHG
jgi:hypothetical protein